MNGKENVLNRFLMPESMAVFGSMQEKHFFGAGVIIKDLLKWGYKGTLYPVHPKADTVYGLKVFRDLGEVDGIPALAVVVTSYRHVPAILEQCGVKASNRSLSCPMDLPKPEPKESNGSRNLQTWLDHSVLELWGRIPSAFSMRRTGFRPYLMKRVTSIIETEGSPSLRKQACMVLRPWPGTSITQE